MIKTQGRKYNMPLFAYIVIFLIVFIGAIFSISFVMEEGKDERGQSILSKATQIALPITTLGIVLQAFYIRFLSPAFKQIEFTIYMIMALIWGTQAISIYI